MAEEGDSPRFPKISGLDEADSKPAGRKGVFGKALYKTFVQPEIDKVGWKFKQFTPKQMAFNALHSTGFGRKLLDLKGNYEFLSDPDNSQFFDDELDSKSDTTKRSREQGPEEEAPSSSPGTGANKEELRAIVSAIQTGTTSLLTALQGIARSADMAAKNSQAGNDINAGTRENVAEILNVLRQMMGGERLNDKVDSLSAEEEIGGEALNEEGEKTKSKFWTLLGTALAGLVTGLRTRLDGMLRSIGTAFRAFGARISGAFKALKIPAIGRLLAPLKKSLSGLKGVAETFGKLLGPLGKIAKSVGRVVGRFGVITTVIMAAIDGVLGAFKGWTEEDGPIWRKVTSALDGALQGIVKGFLEIPKMILQALKGVATGIVNILGFKSLAEKMKAFNLGDWWDRTIGGFIDNLDVFGAVAGVGERLVNIFLDICQFVIKKMLGENAGKAFGAAREHLRIGEHGSKSEQNAPQQAPDGQPLSQTATQPASPSFDFMRNMSSNLIGLFRNQDQARTAAPAAAYQGTVGGNASRGIRNNNPGNIEFNSRNNWQGQIGREQGNGGRFAAFDSTENGIRALARLLQTYSNQGHNTLNSIVRKWAPASDNNDVGAYVRNLQRYVGVGPNDRLNLQDPVVLQKVVRGIVNHENGRSGMSISDAQIQEGVRRALGGQQRAPQPQMTQTPRVDSSVDALSAVAALNRPPAPAVGPLTQIYNNAYNNAQTNVIPPSRPPAGNPYGSPTGPRA